MTTSCIKKTVDGSHRFSVANGSSRRDEYSADTTKTGFPHDFRRRGDLLLKPPFDAIRVIGFAELFQFFVGKVVYVRRTQEVVFRNTPHFCLCGGHTTRLLAEHDHSPFTEGVFQLQVAHTGGLNDIRDTVPFRSLVQLFACVDADEPIFFIEDQGSLAVWVFQQFSDVLKFVRILFQHGVSGPLQYAECPACAQAGDAGEFPAFRHMFVNPSVIAAGAQNICNISFEETCSGPLRHIHAMEPAFSVEHSVIGFTGILGFICFAKHGKVDCIGSRCEGESSCLQRLDSS